MKVLFLTHRLPYAPNRGDRIRAFHILRYLSGIFDVHLVSFVHDAEEQSHTVRLDGLASSVTTALVPRVRNLSRALMAVASNRPLTHVLLDSPDIRPAIARVVRSHKIDVVLAYCSGMARFALVPPLRDLPFVLDMVDVDSVKWRELARASHPPRSWIFRREATRLRSFEQRAVREASATLVVNARERDALAELEPRARIEVVYNGIDTAFFHPFCEPSPECTVIFSGVMNYAPNVQAARWLVRNVWPLVRARVPTARLILAGANPTNSVSRLAEGSDEISVTGTVEDMRPYLWSSAVAVAPLSLARGLQNKVVEAMAAGLPCVVTPPVYEGLPEEVRPASIRAGDVTTFAAAVVDLLSLSPGNRRQIASRANLHALEWSAQLSRLPDILRNAALPSLR